ncbi:MAG: MiaB/RimO family radical SAM methylthiotransferase [Candidatus Omnitrophica bacterium]|nr:MiaB/RimO family radical SAM methylthiotransferase [Candidatus Omnitrophota bacterium]MBU1922906.1 MiaB/RimO family radical SAM methylthiotransferase [Candidatus Omnitrophota bacterium]
MKQKLGILTLGCPRNLVDAESITGRLHSKGYSIVDDMAEAEVALVNTCAFIEEARRESVDAILDLVELKKQGKLKKIIVYGCLAQRYKDLNKELPEVDAFVGTLGLNHESKRLALTPKHYAYLKICEGCVNKCSYCIIPKIKGKLSSLDEKSIIQKVKSFNQEKISELNIIGQDITGFGLDFAGQSRLAGLLSKIIRNAPDIGWIRLLYLNPERITDELLELVREHEQVCKYIDLPVQHINNRILKLMNRRITKKEIISLIDKIREAIPGVCLRTSLIVGFPSETDKEFEELLSFVRGVKFDRLGAFIYSREEDTPAYSFKGQITQKLKQERFDAIMAVQQGISAAVNAKFLGKSVRVLVEEEQDGAYVGRSQADAPEVDGLVYVNTKRSLRSLKIGAFAKVRITDTLEYDLVGEAI